MSRNLNLNHGGVMRCCVETLNTTDGPEDEGTVLPCKWCKSSLIVKGGVWRWNKKAEGL